MRTLVFGLFLLIAAPFEIVLSWYVGWWNSLDWLLAKPFADGMLYFFSLTLCFETIYRSLGHMDHPSKARKATPFVVLTLILTLALFIDFIGASLHLLAQESVAENYRQQLIFTIFALILSGLSYKALETSKRQGV